ncbi:aromatic amino acid transport family protein [Vibrio paucivorans]
MMKSFNVINTRIITGSSVIFGSSVGIGLIILPILAAKVWFSGVLILLIMTMYISYEASRHQLLLIEANPNSDLRAIIKSNLGIQALRVVDGLVVFSLILLIYAFTSIISSSVVGIMDIGGQQWWFAFILCVGFACLLWVDERCISWLMRSANLILFGTMLYLMINECPSIELMMRSSLDIQPLALIELVPVFFAVGFGFQQVLFNITRLHKCCCYSTLKSIQIGVMLIFVISLAWIFFVFVSLGQSSLLELMNQSVSPESFVSQLFQNAGIGHQVAYLFLLSLLLPPLYGVSKGLLDYLFSHIVYAKQTRTFPAMLRASFIIFFPPLLFIAIDPKGYVFAISSVSILFGSVWCVVVPWMCQTDSKIFCRPSRIRGSLVACYWVAMSSSFAYLSFY